MSEKATSNAFSDITYARNPDNFQNGMKKYEDPQIDEQTHKSQT